MSFALIIIGLAAVMTALNNTWKTAPDGGKGLFPQLAADFFTEGYLYWVSALVIVGFVGYVPQLRKPADAFLVLILVAMLLKNGGFFAQFETAIQGTAGSANPVQPANAVSNIGGTGINFNGVTFTNPSNTGAYQPSNLGAALLANSGVGTVAPNTTPNTGVYPPSF